jgi:hypothetical protein
VTLNDGELTIEAASEEWVRALQVYSSRTMLPRIGHMVGKNLVLKITVVGPTAQA